MVKNIYKKGTPHKNIQHYDVIILGAGPAGLTAALYAARYNLDVAVVAKSIGGTATQAGEIENWPGFMGSGTELMKKFKEQAEKFGAKYLENEVEIVKKDENGFVLELNHTSEKKEIHGKALIIALGTENRKLNIKGEKELLGKGVSYCATCDGMFFKNKTVTVIGGANSAAKAALYLSEVAKKVYIIYRKNEMRCEPVSLKKISNTKNIEVIYNSVPKKINGTNKVESIEIETTNNDKKETKTKKTIETDGVFIEIGATPAVDVVYGLKLKMEKDYIVTDKTTKTNVQGVFAAGDNTNNNLKQVVTAAAEGAIAAKSAYDYLRFEYKE